MKKQEIKTNRPKKVETIKFNNYDRPNPLRIIQQRGPYITNDINPGEHTNSYFHLVSDRYVGSPTSTAVIDGVASYILGAGIEFENSPMDFSEYMDEECQENAIMDLKLQGNVALLVVYSEDRSIITNIKWVDVKKIGIYSHTSDITAKPVAFWYCEDWRDKTHYQPYAIPAFGKIEDGTLDLEDFDEDVRNTEILYIKRASQQPIFALPDYQSGLQYCKLEEELSNQYIQYVMNGFSAGGVININQGTPANDEAQDEAEAAILRKVAGSSNAGQIIVSFNDNKENATEWVPFEAPDFYQRFQALSEEALMKIMLSHKVNDPLLFGIPTKSGFNSVSDQMETSQKILFKRQIKPFRNVFIRGMVPVLERIQQGLKIKFIEIEELEVVNPTQNNVTDNSTE